MSPANRLAWTIARHVQGLPAGTAFTATAAATLGVMLAQRLAGSRLCLWGHGGAYDPAGILSLHARPWLFNRRPRARVTLPGVFETQSEPHVLLATPAQIDGAANANLSGIGRPGSPKVAFGGTRGLPDARTVFFVLPTHTSRQLVDRVDFVSTCAATREREALLFTELCVMRWSHETRRWELTEVAPGCGIDELRVRTGFACGEPAQVTPMAEPPEAALALLALLDPLGLRELDFVADRTVLLDAFERIYAAEAELAGACRPARPLDPNRQHEGTGP